MKIVGDREMKELDQSTQTDYHLPEIILMENAGRSSLDRCISNKLVDKTSKVTFLIGNGNNGGDGLVMARHLYFFQDQKNDYIIICLLPQSRRSESNSANLKILRKLGLKIVTPTPAILKEKLLESDLIIDALLGIGVKGNLRVPVNQWITSVNDCQTIRKTTLVALDLPTGIKARPTKNDDPPPLSADFTFTYGTVKEAFYQPINRPRCGCIISINPGFPRQVLETGSTGQILSQLEDIKKKIIPYQLTDYKKTRGRIAIVAGSRGFLGAGLLASLAAQKSGSGLVHFFAFSTDYPIQAKRFPPSIMVKTLDQFPDRPGDLFDAILFGPGWGKSTLSEREIFLEKIKTISIPLIIDADGLYFFKQKWINSSRPINHPTILTPHIGEMAFLCDQTPESILENPIELLLKWSRKLNCFIVLKCHLIYLVTPTGKSLIFDEPNPHLGTGGAGDILAGIICSFCAYYSSKTNDQTSLETAIELAIHCFQQTGLKIKKEKKIFTPEEMIETIPNCELTPAG